MPKLITFPLVLALAAVGQAAFADTTGMCLDQTGTDDAQCTCASEALTEEIGEEDAGLYNSVGLLYLDGKTNGQDMAEAWDAAIEAVAAQNEIGRTALRERMNVAGMAHRDAIAACG